MQAIATPEAAERFAEALHDLAEDAGAEILCENAHEAGWLADDARLVVEVDGKAYLVTVAEVVE